VILQHTWWRKSAKIEIKHMYFMVVPTMGKVAKLSSEMHYMGVRIFCTFLHELSSLITVERFWSWGSD